MEYFRKRQQRYGAAWGTAAALAGVAVAWWVLPESSPDPGRLKRAVWLFGSAHFVELGPLKVEEVVSAFPRLGAVYNGSRPALWYAIPGAAAALGSCGINMSMGRTSRRDYILKNSAAILLGYLPMTLLVLLWSRALGAAGEGLMVVAMGFLALFIGASVLGKVYEQAPAIAVTSLSGLVGIGLLVLLGGMLIARVLIPVSAVAAIGSLLGAGVTYTARNY